MTFIASKVLGGWLQPSNLLLLALALGVVLLWTRWRRAGRWLATLATLAFLAVALVPVGGLLIAALERRFPPLGAYPDRVDGIVVLGGATTPRLTAHWRQPALNEGAERMTAFVALARRYPGAKLIFSGGSSSLTAEAWREADDVRLLLDEIGFDPARVLFDREARNTVENAEFVHALAQPAAGERWLLITSAFHMPRAIGCFRAVGWGDITPYPVDFRTLGSGRVAVRFGTLGTRLRTLDEAVHEWAGLIAYRVMGRTSALFPAP
jgi:uncharacterized SAM-binding protein YcdF (DUF218 family)